MNAFQKWLTKYGTSNLARKLDVSRETVKHWKFGRRCPKADDALSMIKLSNGELTLNDIVKLSRKLKRENDTGKSDGASL